MSSGESQVHAWTLKGVAYALAMLDWHLLFLEGLGRNACHCMESAHVLVKCHSVAGVRYMAPWTATTALWLET